MTKIHSTDALTGEEVLRDMTEAEETNYQNILAETAAAKEAALKAQSDKAALLAKLGISDDEAKLLLS
jgi:phosphopantetheinyl transferase (holo-ACP synthase)